MQGAEKPWFPVIAAGLFTTILTLVGIHFINESSDSFNIMGWYANRIIPIGAILVGILSASGYGLVSWFMGVKINRGLLVAVLVLQVAAYIAAQYVEYLVVLNHLKHTFTNAPDAVFGRFTFLRYMDMAARSIAWKGEHGQQDGGPLGAWGYGVRFLEAAGFCAGGLIAPATLAKHPFCERCQRYMRGKIITVIPATLPTKLFQKADKQAQEEAAANGMRDARELLELARQDKSREFLERVNELKSARKQAKYAESRLSVEMMRCPTCNDGYLMLARLDQKGRSQVRNEIADRVPLSPAFAKAVA